MNRIHRIKVESGEYKICDFTDNQALYMYTMDLDDEIACTFYSFKLKKVALARQIDDQQLYQLVKETNQNNVIEDRLFDVILVGGDGSPKSEQYAHQFIEMLFCVDNDTDIINVVGYDIGHKIHPNSFQIDCYYGGLRSL